MISKEQFIKIIDRLRETNDFVEETNEKARKLDDAVESDFFNAMSLSISHESIVVQLLENMFNDSDYISWWLYELDFGREYKEFCIQQDGEAIDLSTSEKLYDFLIKEMEEQKK